MKTTDSTSLAVCPYPGLRSFSEDESLYFKGRDHQIQIISNLLAQNKFLMVTGASGEGKSSLIYAGLIPNARAGFFKAKYTNWIIADFRPERNPLQNMSQALANEFSISPSSVETELSRGFSSLADLYTSSAFFVDESDRDFMSLPEDGKRSQRRQAHNLLLIVDQFEEFFTNPENFPGESPSQNAQTVVNLLLETARIALQKDLPIYIICTMRSDYIGQCASFRGLPEYIGFSQFFVPRLKRKDIKQVIEEPAVLSGNRITHRLSERLVYDMSEGIDQLPILQHALSQIWLAADHGQKEMDLIHYAQVGGMPGNELPETDQQVFQQWYAGLPDHKKSYFTDTSLQKVIEIHANTLYESAADSYNLNHSDTPISKQDAKRVVALTFSCLTKIDHSRAVRNRMTLQEITDIVNMPDMNAERVGEIINIFREEQNAFIRPFKTEDPESHSLTPETVLDITHESLIRNWRKLNQWATQEYDYYMTYQDFSKQLNRWKESGQNNDFLLPIGPLTYFENWYRSCKPNLGWINRYLDQKDATKEKAAETLTDIQTFIGKSARKVRFTRLFMRYGASKIALFTALITVLALSVFYWLDANSKQNHRVINRIQSESADLLKSKEVSGQVKSFYQLTNEHYKSGSLMPYLTSLDSKTRLTEALNVYNQITTLNKSNRLPIKSELKSLLQKDLIQMEKNQVTDPGELLTDLNRFLSLAAFDWYYQPDDSTAQMLSKISQLGYTIVRKHFENLLWFKPTLPFELNYSLHHWLSFGNPEPQQIQSLIDLLQPTSGEKKAFETYYPKGSFETSGRLTINNNGGYHTLASLYAATGQTDKIISIYEAMHADGQSNYFTGSLFNNYTQIVGLLYRFGHRDKAKVLIRKLTELYPTNTALTVYRNTVNRSGYISAMYRINIAKNIMRSNKGYFFPTLCFLPRPVYRQIMEDYEHEVKQVSNLDEKNYLLSLNSKRKTIFDQKYYFDRGLAGNTTEQKQWMGEAVEYFKKIKPDYLKEEVAVTLPYFSDGTRSLRISRRNMLIYPDYADGWFSEIFHSDIFFNYLAENGHLKTYYSSAADLEALHLWVARAHLQKPGNFGAQFDNTYALPEKVYEKILVFVDSVPYGKSFDANLLYLILSNRYFQRKDTISALAYSGKINLPGYSRSLNRYEYLEKTFLMNQVKDQAVNLATLGRHTAALDFINLFPQTYEKALAYIMASEMLYKTNNDPMSFVYLDSVFSLLPKINFSELNGAYDPRFRLFRLLSRIGSDRIDQQSRNFFKEIPESAKFNALVERIIGVTAEGNFYLATESIPDRLTENEELWCRFLILNQAARNQDSPEQKQNWKFMDYLFDYNYYYINYLPN